MYIGLEGTVMGVGLEGIVMGVGTVVIGVGNDLEVSEGRAYKATFCQLRTALLYYSSLVDGLLQVRFCSGKQ